jgi:hypothetical protein
MSIVVVVVVGGIKCNTSFFAHPITVCYTSWFISASPFRHIAQRRTGRSGMLSGFWLPVKRSSVFFLIFVRGERPRVMYVLRYSDQFKKIISIF